MEKFREIEFYETESGRSPVRDFIESTRRDERAKIMEVLKNVELMQRVPTSYLKKFLSREKIWEVRVRRYRFLGFLANPRLLVLTNGFIKKTQTTPGHEIDVAIQRQKMYLAQRELL